jgi:hypothetical protein
MASRQGGAALLVLLAVLAIGASWFMVSKLDAMSASATVRNRQYNAEVLLRAKQALIGYVAAQAMKAGENNPGSLPCPEDPANFDSATGNQGKMGVNCGTTVKVGRFPWLTIGLDKLTDASGEPLWYVVSPNWSYNIGTNSNINSNSAGNLTVDGVANAAVALIIAPGPAFSVPACSGSAAINQARALAGTPDWRNYLECENASNPTDTTFVTSGPDGSFNDQVMVVTAADMLPGIEAAIASRIEKEIAPVLKSMYSGTKWNASAGQAVLPFAAPFADPSASNYQGAAATAAGLLPFSYSPACSPAGDARCTASTYHAWNSSTVSKTAGSGSLWIGPDCTVSGAYVTCTGYYNGGSLTASFDDRLSNMGNALRTFTETNHTVRVWTILYDGWSWGSWVEQSSGSLSKSRRFNSNASLSFLVGGLDLRWAWGTDYGYYYIEAQRPAVSDHALLSSTDPTTGWFVRNEWYRLAYYAVASNYAPGGSLSCTTGSTCLTVTNLAPAGAQRAILILAGRSINGTARPSSALANYLESGNATSSYIKLPATVSSSVPAAQRFNDRIVVVDTN